MTAQTSLIGRMRAGDIRSVPVGVWPLLGLAVLDAYLLIRERGLAFDPSDAPSIFLRVAPFLFAATVAFRAPADRRFLWGALALCASEFFALGRLFALSTGGGSGIGEVEPFRMLSWALSLAGLLLIGKALGGVKTRNGWLAVGFGVLVAIASNAAYLAAWMNPEPAGLELFLLTPLDVLAALLGATVLIGWGYLLGSALERSKLLTAAGAGLVLGLAAFGVVVSQIAPAMPGTDFTITNLISLTLQVLAWAALIAAAVTEFGPPRPAPAEVSGEANTKAEAAA